MGLRAQNKAVFRFLPEQKGCHFTYHPVAQFWHRVLWIPEVLQAFKKPGKLMEEKSVKSY